MSAKPSTCGQTAAGGASISTEVKTSRSGGAFRFTADSGSASSSSAVAGFDSRRSAAISSPTFAPSMPSGTAIGSAIAIQRAPSRAKSSVASAAMTTVIRPSSAVRGLGPERL